LIKPVVFCLSDLCNWQKEIGKTLIPFPIGNKLRQQLPKTLALLRVLVRVTKLATLLDTWKVQFLL